MGAGGVVGHRWIGHGGCGTQQGQTRKPLGEASVQRREEPGEVWSEDVWPVHRQAAV